MNGPSDAREDKPAKLKEIEERLAPLALPLRFSRIASVTGRDRTSCEVRNDAILLLFCPTSQTALRTR
jgi:hypothetical protein